MIFQYILDLGISFLSIYSILTHTFLYPCIYLIGFSLSLDTVFQLTTIKPFKPEFFIHHILGLLFILFVQFHPIPDFHDFIYSIFTVEISSIFLTFRHLYNPYFPNKTFQKINDILFFITFFYYRILYYPYALFRPRLFTLIYTIGCNDTYPLFTQGLAFTAIFGLYFLNLYWLYYILKRVAGTTPHTIKNKNEK